MTGHSSTQTDGEVRVIFATKILGAGISLTSLYAMYRIVKHSAGSKSAVVFVGWLLLAGLAAHQLQSNNK